MTRRLYRSWEAGWVKSLDTRSDPARFERGLRYLRDDAVQHMVVGPGRIIGLVSGSRRSPYDVNIAVPTISSDELAAVPLPYLAELLTANPDPDVLDRLLEAAPTFIPQPDSFAFSCSCPDWGDPCKHAIALALAFARELAADLEPFLRLRGLDRRMLLEAMMGAVEKEELTTTNQVSGQDVSDDVRVVMDDVVDDVIDDVLVGPPAESRSLQRQVRESGQDPLRPTANLQQFWHGRSLPSAGDYRIVHGADQAPAFVLRAPLPWRQRANMLTYLETIAAAYDLMKEDT